MINNKTITLYSIAWGNQLEITKRVMNYCATIFPHFDQILLKDDINNLLDFNTFMVEGIYKDIQTDFVLIVQADGFILNPDLWQDKFLHYDYIGAPWPWHKVVGNGGFCIKSKKFLETASKLKYDPKHHEYPLCPEDYFLCVQNRNQFIDNGCLFADVKTGLQFSFEHPISSLPNHTINNSFGFHGKHNLSIKGVN